MVVPILGEMSSQLNNIEWAMRVDINDGQLVSEIPGLMLAPMSYCCKR